MNITVIASDNALQRKLIHQLNSRISELTPKSVYSLEAIVGADYWQDEPESHRSLGRYFSSMVNKGRAPFTTAGWTLDRHNKYRYTA